MKISEFKKIEWRAGIMVEYRGKEYSVGSVDFEETLIALVDPNLGNDITADDFVWVRCEHCDIVKPEIRDSFGNIINEGDVLEICKTDGGKAVNSCKAVVFWDETDCMWFISGFGMLLTWQAQLDAHLTVRVLGNKQEDPSLMDGVELDDGYVE